MRAHIVEAMAFGDLFLADIRAYREKQMARTGLEPLFPVWQIPTADLAQTMIASGLRAKITCVDPKVPPERVCRPAISIPIPRRPAPKDRSMRGKWGVPFFCLRWPRVSPGRSTSRVGEIVERDGFVFADLMLKG